MKLVYFHDRRGNFGDDLNPLLWNALFPDHGRAPELHLVGVGSILNQAMFAPIPPAAQLAILGSGVSYGPPPRLSPHWHLLGVRGPLSAALLGAPEAAITDGAILLAAAEGLRPARAGTGRALFMPHAMSASPGWRAAAREAGMDYADPMAPVIETLGQIAQARLVVTEAMHGAIVADTLRVPWLPVRISPRFDAFKWRDWGLSMDVPITPCDLPSAGAREHVRNRRQQRRFLATGSGDMPEFDAATSCETMVAYLERRHLGQPYAAPPAPARGQGVFRRLAGPLVDLADPVFMARAAPALRLLADEGGVLSDDRLFARRLDQMMAAAGRMRALIDMAARGAA